MNNKKWITTGEAIQLIKKEVDKTITLPTLINWIEKYKLGHKLAGRWEVDQNKLIVFLKESRDD